MPGLPTSNGCPATTYIAQSTGIVITRLLEAGAILVGKTNMDQFAIGLVGTRSPYGPCSSVFNKNYISGGSSSGSAVAVAGGLVSFAMANDAAGSGRVPAAFNNIVGLKPTPGVVSNSCISRGGNVKTIETISILALTCDDALEILQLVAGYEPEFPFSKPEAANVDLRMPPKRPSFTFGVPDAAHLEFFGNAEAGRLFEEAIDRMISLGGKAVEVDFSPLNEAQKILYDGPWIAERSLGLRDILASRRNDLHPVTRTILETAKQYSAEDTFAAIHRIAELKCQTRPIWKRIDFLLVPTTPTIYTIAEVEKEPISLNSRLGIYTNFANLMDLCGVAIPNGFLDNGFPQGVTLLGPQFQEARLSRFGREFDLALGRNLGATPNNLRATVHAPVPSHETSSSRAAMDNMNTISTTGMPT